MHRVHTPNRLFNTILAILLRFLAGFTIGALVVMACSGCSTIGGAVGGLSNDIRDGIASAQRITEGQR